MEFFGFARMEGFPTQYPAIKTPVTVDVLESGFIAAFLILLVSFYSIIIGFKVTNGVSFATRVTISATIGVIIMLGNFGQEWEVGHIHSKTPYKAGTKHEIEADIGIKVGLRSVNVTLKADTQNETNELRGEIINYNERFEWTWDQGRFGFGSYAGLLQREFRAAQRRGLPLPILWIIDYLVVDGEGLRFGRYYRTAGWYAHIAAWAALPCWMMANVLFLSVVKYGVIFTLLTGAFQLLSCLLWVSIRNPFELIIAFEDDVLSTRLGASFWLMFSGGVMCFLVSLIVVIADLRFPDETVAFFGIDPLSTYEEKTMTTSEYESKSQASGASHSQDTEMAPLRNTGAVQMRNNAHIVSYLERRSVFKKAQKNLKRNERHQQRLPEHQPVDEPDVEYVSLVNEKKEPANEVARRPPPPPPSLPKKSREGKKKKDQRRYVDEPGPSSRTGPTIAEDEELPEYAC